jgi:hypothetical protein
MQIAPGLGPHYTKIVKLLGRRADMIWNTLIAHAPQDEKLTTAQIIEIASEYEPWLLDLSPRTVENYIAAILHCKLAWGNPYVYRPNKCRWAFANHDGDVPYVPPKHLMHNSS